MDHTFDEAYIESLFAQAEAFLDDNPYTDVTEQPSFFTKLKGVLMEGRQEIIAKLTPETPIFLERDPFNPHDKFAIKVVTKDGLHIGFLARKLALVLAPLIDRGEEYSVSISSITGGTEGRNFGVNVCLIKEGAYQLSIEPGLRKLLSQLPEKALFDRIRKTVLGSYDYHPKQLEAIKALLDGENVLAVFGTGRGKSAIFQTVAAYRALKDNQVTVITYPLRALANDQYLTMQNLFAALGLRVYRANGSISSEERFALFQAIYSGEVDVLLATPEFMVHHISKLGAIINRIGLFVADEAHHVADTHRPAYKRLDKVISLLQNPQTLAVTATADDDTAKKIIAAMGSTRVIVDNHVRSNLEICDERNQENKDRYLLEHVARGKSIIYTGTRKEAVRIARLIRESLPGFTYSVGFYHAGMSSRDRLEVENLFRQNVFKVIVATSAFGEGINISDVTDVFLYHLMYNFTDFNQMSGRAGRSGEPARIHVLFGNKDTSLNWHIVKSQAPDRDQVYFVYQAIRALPSVVANAEIANKAKALGRKNLNETAVSVCLGVLEELGIIERITNGNKREIFVISEPENIKVDDSLRYKEGLEELVEFSRFRVEILNMSGEALKELVQKPICPRPDLLEERVDMAVNFWLE